MSTPVEKIKEHMKKYQNQKGFVIPLIIAIVAIFALGGVVYVAQKKEVKAPVIIDQISTTTNPIVGGDKDIHGCIGSAGYSWCEVKNKCLRVWEEKCENTPINSGPGDKDGSVACTMDAMMCPDGTYVGRSAPDCKFICPVSANCIPEGGLSYENIQTETPINQNLQCCPGLVPKVDLSLADAPQVCVKK